jgi:hypothetical protein
MGGEIPKAENVLPKDVDSVSTLIIHPDIIKRILNRCIEKEKMTGLFYDHYFKAYIEYCSSLKRYIN